MSKTRWNEGGGRRGLSEAERSSPYFGDRAFSASGTSFGGLDPAP
jgi:hypothetical protein